MKLLAPKDTKVFGGFILWAGGEDGESRRTVNPFPMGVWVRIPPFPLAKNFNFSTVLVNLKFLKDDTW